MNPILFIHLDLTDLCVPVDSPLVEDKDLASLLIPHPYHAGFLVPSTISLFCDQYQAKHQRYGIQNIIFFPRIQNAIEYVKSGGVNVNRVIIISSDPPKASATIPSTHGLIYFLKKWVLQLLGDEIKLQIIPIKGDFFHYSSWFNTLKSKLPNLLKSHHQYYWVTGGQLPSINFALFLNLLPFENQFNIIGYNPVNRDCFPLKLTSDLYQQRVINETIFLSQKYEYAAIINILHSEKINLLTKMGSGLLTLEWGKVTEQKPLFNGLIDGLDQHFEVEEDIDESPEVEMDKLPEGDAKASALLNEILITIDSLSDVDDLKSRPSKLIFIYLSAKIRYFKQQNYSDFLMRIFTMAEVLLLPELAPLISKGKLLNIRLADLVPDREAPQIPVASIFSDHDKQEFVQNYVPYPYNWKIGSKRQPSFFFHRAIWECFFEKVSDFREGPKVFLKDILVYIDALRKIRNKVAHNLEGTGQNEILNSFVNIDGDPKKPGRLFMPINKKEYNLKYEEYEKWISLPQDEAKMPEPSASWSDDEMKKLLEAHEANFFTLCDKYFGIHMDGVPYNQNFGFFDTHINPLIKYYLGITDNP